MEPITKGLQTLVELYHAGSVNDAANFTGIPQRTLARYAKGETLPRADHIRTLADAYGVSDQWLVRGEGPEPQPRDTMPAPEALRYAAVIEELDLPLPVANALYDLAAAPQLAAILVARGGAVGKGRNATIEPSIVQAARGAFRVWTNWLEGCRATIGDEALRRALASQLPLVRLGFSPIAHTLLADESVDLRALDAAATYLAGDSELTPLQRNRATFHGATTTTTTTTARKRRKEK